MTTESAAAGLSAPQIDDGPDGSPLRPRPVAPSPECLRTFERTWGDGTAGHLLLSRSEAHDLYADVQALADLLLELRRRQPEELLAAAGLGPGPAAVLHRLGGDPVEVTLRADVVLTPDGPRVVEINWGSRLGGYDLDLLHDRATGVLPVGTLVADPPGQRLVTAIRRRVPRGVPTAQIRPLLVCGGTIKPEQPMMRSIAARLDDHLSGVRLIGLHDLHRHVADLGSRTHAVLRYFQVDDLVDDPTAEAAVGAVLAAHRAGTCLLWSAMGGAVLASTETGSIPEPPGAYVPVAPSGGSIGQSRGGSSPTRPSIASRSRSMCPV